MKEIKVFEKSKLHPKRSGSNISKAPIISKFSCRLIGPQGESLFQRVVVNVRGGFNFHIATNTFLRFLRRGNL